jgi:antitoxin component YwqK of YwqJK toxin-antitoxin module
MTEGDFTRDRETGRWVYWYENGNKMMEGDFNEGVRAGKWSYYYEKGNLNSEIMHKDSFSLMINYWDPAGKQCVREGNGRIETFYENGQKGSAGNVHEGLNEGPWSYWRPDGKLREEGSFAKGVYTLVNSWDTGGKKLVDGGNGYHKTFYDNGVVGSECPYRNGKPNGLQLVRNQDNIMQSEINIKDGKSDGHAKQYTTTGELLNEGTFQNNLQHGLWTWYHLNGKKESEVNFVRGEKEGEQTFYSESAVIVKREFYTKGKLVKEEVY